MIVVFAFCGFVLLILSLDRSSGVSVSPSVSPSLSSTHNRMGGVFVFFIFIIFIIIICGICVMFCSWLDLHLQARFSWLSG